MQFLLLGCLLPAFSALALSAHWNPVRTGKQWMTAALVVELADIAFWRSKTGVDGLARHPWLAVVEGVCLVAGGTGVWSFLVSGPPRERSGTPYPWRMFLAASAMWFIWVMAYLVGFSNTTWYPAYARQSGLSVSADQQIATGLLWVGAGLTFLPVIFWCLWRWLAPEKTGDA